MKLNALLAGVVMATVFTSTSALTVTPGNDPQPAQSNVVRNACGLPDATATDTLIQGCLNDNHSILVDLLSNEVITFTEGGGQAAVNAVTGPFSTLTIRTGSFSTAILNIDSTVDAFVTFEDAVGFSTEFALNDNGNNFFTITGIQGNTLTFFSRVNGLQTEIVSDVKQIRLGPAVTPVPEPETYALMMAGLAAVGFISRRRKTKSGR